MLPAGQEFTLLSSWFVAELPSRRCPATGGEQDHGTQPLSVFGPCSTHLLSLHDNPLLKIFFFLKLT